MQKGDLVRCRVLADPEDLMGPFCGEIKQTWGKVGIILEYHTWEKVATVLIQSSGEVKRISSSDLELIKRSPKNKKRLMEQANKINSWGKNVYVKIPVINSKNIFMGKIIRKLNQENIKINITAVYSFAQVKKILKLINKKTKVIISIFAGRAGDTGKDPVPEFKKSIQLTKKFKNVEILWASVREPYNYLQAKQLGCQIITVPPSIIEKIEKFGKSFNRLSLETVKGFLKDSKKSKFRI